MLRGAHDQHVGGFGVSDSGAIREDEDLLVCGVELRRRAFEVEDSYIAAVGLALRRSFQASTLKVSLGYHDGFIGEGQISYAGPNAMLRAELARDVLAERLRDAGISELRFDLVGLNSIHGPTLSANAPAPYEVRLRVTGRVASQKFATRVPREVEALYTNGPAGGGAAGSTREVIAIHSALIPRGAITHMVHYEES